MEAFEKDYQFPEFAQKDGIGKKCLQALLSPEDSKKKGVVTATTFGELLEWFGPLKSDKHVVGRVNRSTVVFSIRFR